MTAAEPELKQPEQPNDLENPLALGDSQIMDDSEPELPPPSIADTILLGRDMRFKLKGGFARAPKKDPKMFGFPKMARPGTAVVGVSGKAAKAQIKCLRRNRTACSDRMNAIARPSRRKILNIWREYAHVLPTEIIERMRKMCDTSEPFKPDQAYDYFVHVKKMRKKNRRLKKFKPVLSEKTSSFGSQGSSPASNFCVLLAYGVQKRLEGPEKYQLSGDLQILSNVIREELSCFMRIRNPAQCDKSKKAIYINEVSGKIAVWIDQILAECDERMLDIDDDEYKEVEQLQGGSETSFSAGKGGPPTATSSASSGSKNTLKQPSSSKKSVNMGNE